MNGVTKEMKTKCYFCLQMKCFNGREQKEFAKIGHWIQSVCERWCLNVDGSKVMLLEKKNSEVVIENALLYKIRT